MEGLLVGMVLYCINEEEGENIPKSLGGPWVRTCLCNKAETAKQGHGDPRHSQNAGHRPIYLSGDRDFKKDAYEFTVRNSDEKTALV